MTTVNVLDQCKKGFYIQTVHVVTGCTFLCAFQFVSKEPLLKML